MRITRSDQPIRESKSHTLALKDSFSISIHLRSNNKIRSSKHPHSPKARFQFVVVWKNVKNVVAIHRWPVKRDPSHLGLAFIECQELTIVLRGVPYKFVNGHGLRTVYCLITKRRGSCNLVWSDPLFKTPTACFETDHFGTNSWSKWSPNSSLTIKSIS